MKRIAVATVVLVALTFGLAPKAAHAGGGHFWGGFAAGTATGLVVGTLAAPRYYAPAPAYYAPAPVYVAPSPVCRDYQTGGYWRQVPVVDAGGFTSYQNVWVPGGVQRVCQ